MKILKAILFLATIIVAVQFPFTSKSENKQNPSDNFIDGEILVKFKSGQSNEQVHRNIGATVLKEFSQIGWQHVRLPENMSVNEGIKLYNQNPAIEKAQPNFIYTINLTPNDPRYSELYGMPKISAPTAWDTTTGSNSIIVAVIDTGVNYNHEDLSPNMWRNPNETAGNSIDDDNNGFVDDVYGYDFINNDNDPMDDNSHGSHCAGTIGGAGNNGLGVVGVSWTVRLMALKTHQSNGNSTAVAVISAFQYVAMMRNRGVNIRVTSNSWSGPPEAPAYDQALKDAIDAAGNAGVLNVIASGNDARNVDTQPAYPGSYDSPSVLSIAASDSSDNKASFSNFGTTSVDLAAPGVGILSTVLGTSSYGFKSGTSMATPHVSGAAALLLAANSSLSMASVKATLMNTVDILPQWNGQVLTGGRLNISRAIQNQTVCSYSLGTDIQNMPASGGSASTSVNAQTNCGYMAISNANWITVTQGNPGAGNGNVNYSVAANNTGSPRTGTITIAGKTLTVNQAGSAISLRAVFMDFDGDGKSDYAVTRNQGGQLYWYVFLATGNYIIFPFGLNGDVAVPEDYDGDRKFDFAVWRPGNPGVFYVWQSFTNSLFAIQHGGSTSDPRVTQDYDGDGKADPTVVSVSGGSLAWNSYLSLSGAFSSQFAGLPTDRPLRGDFDGDAKADIAYYTGTGRSPQNVFFIKKSSNGTVDQRYFGLGNSDYVVAGDFDGDGKTDVAIWRGKTAGTDGTWWWQNSSNNAFNVIQWGIGGYDVPVPADYDGDGRTDQAIWRPDSQAAFYANRSTEGFFAFPWGLGTDNAPAFGVSSH